MILLSVGTQLPFDRLVMTVDRWAAQHRDVEIIAQIGPSHYVPTAMTSQTFIDPTQFRDLQSQCTLMISHAGIGSIISAMEMGKPLIILTRDHKRNEHRNGHQISTGQRFSHMPGVYVARDEHHLIELLDRAEFLKPSQLLSPHAPADFVKQVRDYIANASPTPIYHILWRALRGVCQSARS